MKPSTTDILWTPGPEPRKSSRLVQSQDGLAREKGLATHDGAALWRWSVPDAVVPVSEIPRTLSGKKMEVPVRKLLLGASLSQVASPDGTLILNGTSRGRTRP